MGVFHSRCTEVHSYGFQQIAGAAVSRFKFRLWNCPSYPQDSKTAGLHKAIIMNKAVTVLHCDRFCIIIANCPRPTQPISKSALSHSLFVLQSSVCLYGFAFALSPSTAKFSNAKIRHLSKQRILYIQFSALVKMVSGSKAIMLQQHPPHPTMTATYQIITLYNSAVPPSSANCHHFQRRNLVRHIAAGGT